MFLGFPCIRRSIRIMPSGPIISASLESLQVFIGERSNEKDFGQNRTNSSNELFENRDTFKSHELE